MPRQSEPPARPKGWPQKATLKVVAGPDGGGSIRDGAEDCGGPCTELSPSGQGKNTSILGTRQLGSSFLLSVSASSASDALVPDPFSQAHPRPRAREPVFRKLSLAVFTVGVPQPPVGTSPSLHPLPHSQGPVTPEEVVLAGGRQSPARVHPGGTSALTPKTPAQSPSAHAPPFPRRVLVPRGGRHCAHGQGHVSLDASRCPLHPGARWAQDDDGQGKTGQGKTRHVESRRGVGKVPAASQGPHAGRGAKRPAAVLAAKATWTEAPFLSQMRAGP
ncbi:unnamed protein product [Rangifer tarandus platyrhynchus]|uniref:Uncharacterized protein n=1 Tax=Rangifer tarandus platyrhynchus TaxID=3082113 RepID=A0AC59YRZ1_RANTA